MREPPCTQPDVPRDRALYADVVGGVTTFFTMAYIVVVNPGILSTPGTGMPFSGALTATVLIASSMTLLMGRVRAPAVRGGARHGPQRLLRVHDRAAGQGAVADGARHGLLGRRAVPGRVGHAVAGTHRAGDPSAAPIRRRGGHRPAAHVHRPAQRRAHRRRSGDAGAHGHARSPRGVPAARHPRRGGADATEQSVGVSGGHLLGDRARLDVWVREAAGAAWSARPIFRRRSWRSTSAARSGSRCCRRLSRSSSPICSIRCRRSSASRPRPASPIRTAVRSTCVAA